MSIEEGGVGAAASVHGEIVMLAARDLGLENAVEPIRQVFVPAEIVNDFLMVEQSGSPRRPSSGHGGQRTDG